MNEQYLNEPLSQNKTLIPLENIRVANPCRADWNLMQGDARVRFCGSCEKHVYNLSALSKADAEKLIEEKEGRLCVRYFQRADGTVLTGNCPVGMRVARRPFKFLMAGFAVLAASGVSIFTGHASTLDAPNAETSPRRNAGFLRAVIERFDSDTSEEGDIAGPPLMGKPAPAPAPTPRPENSDPIIMGEICVPAPTPTPQPEPKEKE